MRCRAGWAIITQTALDSRKPSQLGPDLARPGLVWHCLAPVGTGPGRQYLFVVCSRRCTSLHSDRAPDDTQAHPAAFRRNRSSKPRPIWGPHKDAATRDEIGTGGTTAKCNEARHCPSRLPCTASYLPVLPALRDSTLCSRRSSRHSQLASTFSIWHSSYCCAHRFLRQRCRRPAGRDPSSPPPG